jgi:hypothetical protein
MFKGCNIINGEVSLAALVIGMALLALICVRQAAVQAPIADPLFGDICMTAFASLGCGSTPRCMTQSAFLLKLGMRSISRYWFISWASR